MSGNKRFLTHPFQIINDIRYHPVARRQAVAVTDGKTDKRHNKETLSQENRSPVENRVAYL